MSWGLWHDFYTDMRLHDGKGQASFQEDCPGWIGAYAKLHASRLPLIPEESAALLSWLTTKTERDGENSVAFALHHHDGAVG